MSEHTCEVKTSTLYTGKRPRNQLDSEDSVLTRAKAAKAMQAGAVPGYGASG